MSQDVEWSAGEVPYDMQDRLSSQSRRVLAAVCLGSFFLWYTFYLFVALACVSSRSLFFRLPWATHFSLFLLLITGYTTRSVGAVFFSWLADRHGWSFVLRLVNVLYIPVCLALFLLPRYHENLSMVGFIAMVLLCALQSILLKGYTTVSGILVVKNVQSGHHGLGIALLTSAGFLGCFFAFFFVFASHVFLTHYVAFYVQWYVLSTIGIALTITSWPCFAGIEQHEQDPVAQRLALGAVDDPRRSSSKVTLSSKVALFMILGVGLGYGTLNMMFLFAVIYLYQVVHATLFVIYVVISVALCVAVPCGIFFGWLSDRVGRTKIILAAFLLAATSYHSLFLSLIDGIRPGVAELSKRVPIVLYGPHSDCHTGFVQRFWTRGSPKLLGVGCSFARDFFNYYGLTVQYVVTPYGQPVVLKIGQNKIARLDHHALLLALATAGYSLAVHFHTMHMTPVLLIFVLLLLYVVMVRAPVVVCLLENVSYLQRNFFVVSILINGSSLWVTLLCVSGLFWINPAFQLYPVVVPLACSACFVSILVSLYALRNGYDLLMSTPAENQPAMVATALRSLVSTNRVRTGY